MSMMMRFPKGLEKAFTMSYDDGVAQDIRLAGIMKKNGLSGTFNINTGTFAKEDAVGAGRMSERQVKELYSDPSFEVAVHAYTHPHLEALTAAQVTREVLLDKENIERLFGVVTRGMAYPYGSYNDTVLNCLKASGIVYSRTTVSTENFFLPQDWLRLPATCHHNCPRLMTLADQFLSIKLRPVDPVRMFYLWGHSYEFDTNSNWNVIEDFAAKIGGHDDVWYATNIEIYNYVEAYGRMRVSADGTLAENPTAVDLYFMYNQNLVCLEAGKTVKLA